MLNSDRYKLVMVRDDLRSIVLINVMGMDRAAQVMTSTAQHSYGAASSNHKTVFFNSGHW